MEWSGGGPHKAFCLTEFLSICREDTRQRVLDISKIPQQALRSVSLYTAKLQWLKHLWNHEKMFEMGAV